MSVENVELHLRAVEAFNHGDLDAFLALSHEEIETESRLAAMEGGYQGHEGVRRWWRNLFDFFSDYKVEVEELDDLCEVTLALQRAEAHGAASTTPLVETIWQAARWREGKCVWWRNFNSEAEALETIGFSGSART
jgi:GH15 family glucan-1,4-alpha-glucosidase